MKTNICRICGWSGSTHLHHIIPLSDYGEDINENIIEICPNHHSEAQNDEEEFAKKYNIEGIRFSKDKLESLKDASIMFARGIGGNSSSPDFKELCNIIDKYKFDKFDLIAFMMGITKKSVEMAVVNK